jgi:hypothetical protein
MGLFSKKEEVPKLPTAPALPELPKLGASEPKKELPELPSFPSSSKNDTFNQEMLKSAVTDMPSPGENEVHAQPKTLPVVEEKKEESMASPSPPLQNSMPTSPKMPTAPIAPTLPTAPTTPTLPTAPPTPTLPAAPQLSPKVITPKPAKPKSIISASSIPTQQDEPIFIRIDKFQASQKNFETIKSKVEEIESVLRKIDDVKSQEEEELKGWTEDIEKIKSRLAEIDDDIFNQI